MTHFLLPVSGMQLQRSWVHCRQDSILGNIVLEKQCSVSDREVLESGNVLGELHTLKLEDASHEHLLRIEG